MDDDETHDFLFDEQWFSDTLFSHGVEDVFLADFQAAWMRPEEPPNIQGAELDQVKQDAMQEEISRLVELGVLKDVAANATKEELPDTKLSTTFAFDWRWKPVPGAAASEDGSIPHRWQYRARLVAREFAFCDPNRRILSSNTAPSCGPLLLLHQAACDKDRVLWSADISDAYLQVEQPTPLLVTDWEDKSRRWTIHRLLPGQRVASRLWEEHLGNDMKAHGLDSCPLAPAIFSSEDKKISVCTHVDDLLISAYEERGEALLCFLSKKYKVAVHKCGKVDDTILFLKKRICKHEWGYSVEMAPKHLQTLVELLELETARERKVPLPSDALKRIAGQSDELDEELRAKYCRWEMNALSAVIPRLFA